MISYKFANFTAPDDWVLKLVSLCFAIFLWYFVAGEDKVDVNIQVPIEIVNLPRELVIANQFKKELEVTVSGPRGLVKDLANKHATRSVDLSKAGLGNFEIRNDLDSIRFPRGIRVLRIQPTHVSLLLDQLVKKDLPIKVRRSGEPAEGFLLDSIGLEPDEITVAGPKSVLDEVTALHTVPINLHNLKISTVRQVALDIKPAIANLIGEPIVTARINIREQMVDKIIGKLPISVLHPPAHGGVQLAPKTVTIQTQIPYNTVQEVDDLSSLFEAKVDVEGLASGRHELNVEISLPPRAVTLNLMPAKVVATIGKDE